MPHEEREKSKYSTLGGEWTWSKNTIVITIIIIILWKVGKKSYVCDVNLAETARHTQEEKMMKLNSVCVCVCSPPSLPHTSPHPLFLSLKLLSLPSLHSSSLIPFLSFLPFHHQLFPPIKPSTYRNPSPPLIFFFPSFIILPITFTFFPTSVSQY